MPTVSNPAGLNPAGRYRCGVLGHPIRHSLSPVMHRAAYTQLGLDWEYDAYDVDLPGLAGFLGSCGPQWRGLSLTMPLKRAVLPLLNRRSALTHRVGVANTVVFEDGVLHGHNTDVAGVAGALGESGMDAVRTAVLVGAGATADSVFVALQDLGLRRLHVAVRDPERAGPFVGRASSAGVQVTVGALADLAADAPQDLDLMVSTVPGSADTGVDNALLSRTRLVLDVAYDPWPSPLLTRASAAGAGTVDGVTMLAYQAQRQVGLMTGRDVRVDVLRTAARTSLESRR